MNWVLLFWLLINCIKWRLGNLEKKEDTRRWVLIDSTICVDKQELDIIFDENWLSYKAVFSFYFAWTSVFKFSKEEEEIYPKTVEKVDSQGTMKQRKHFAEHTADNTLRSLDS